MDNKETIFQKSAVICNINIPCWTGVKKLPEMDAKFKRDHGIDADGEISTTYVKLMGSSHDLIKEIKSKGKEARRVHERFIVCRLGARGDNVVNFLTLGKIHKALEPYRDDVMGRVEDFCNSYEQLKQDALAELNGVVPEDFFPSVEEVRSKFGFELDIRSIPTSNILDNKLGNKEAEEEIRTSTAKALEKTMNESIKNVFDRFITQIENINTQSKGKKGIADTSLDNFANFLSILPELNIFKDKAIDKAYEDAKQLLKYDAEQTKDQSVKDELADKSQSILDDLNQFYGG